jgi:hypothetical protein
LNPVAAEQHLRPARLKISKRKGVSFMQVLKAFTLAALAMSLIATVPAPALANPNNQGGYRDSAGTWHNADGSIPGHPHGYRDASGTWHNADGSVPGRTYNNRTGCANTQTGGGGGATPGYRDARGVWHNPASSVLVYVERSGKRHGKDRHHERQDHQEREGDD